MFVRIPDYDNDEPSPQPENGNGENGRPSVYTLLFWIIFSGRMLAFVRRINYHWLLSPGNIAAVVESVLTAGILVCLLMLVDYYIWPAFVAWWKGPDRPGTAAPKAPQPPMDPPADEPEEPRQAEQTAVSGSTAVMDNGEEWVLIGNKPIYLSDHNVSMDDWLRLKSARENGRMPDVSPTSLQEKVGLDGEAARNLNAMLMHLGMARDGGYRQPNKWTALGNQVLPSPASRRVVH
jgi:hypothetical protein